MVKYCYAVFVDRENLASDCFQGSCGVKYCYAVFVDRENLASDCFQWCCGVKYCYAVFVDRENLALETFQDCFVVMCSLTIPMYSVDRENLASDCSQWCCVVKYCYAVFVDRENLASDCFQGCFVVTCTLCAFISLVWLREQILHGGGPDWLEHDNQAANHARVGWIGVLIPPHQTVGGHARQPTEEGPVSYYVGFEDLRLPCKTEV